MSQPPDRHDGGECQGCALGQPRRAFVRDIGLAAFGALLMVGLPADLAAAMRPRAIKPLRRNGADPSYPIPAKDGVQIDLENDVILVRWQNAIIAFNLSCPHQNTALRWNAGKAEFQCSKHHSRYQPDGTFIDGRATRNMDRFSLTRSGNVVTVHVDLMRESDVDQAGWATSILRL